MVILRTIALIIVVITGIFYEEQGKNGESFLDYTLVNILACALL
jgi:hypothetical protein